jgi:hypothetical protein
MVIKEFYKTREDGVNLYRTYSDENFRIKQVETSMIFDEAIDVETSNYTYEETNELIELEETVGGEESEREINSRIIELN